MNADISIYTIALEWIRVPHYALPAVIAGLALLGVVFLRNSRVAAIKTKQAAIRKARHRVEQIEDCLDLGLRELHFAVPDDRWEPSGRESLSEVPRKPIIDPRTDERCRDLIDHLIRVCDTHLPEFRRSVRRIESYARDFAQGRRDVLSRRNAVLDLECRMIDLSAEELDAIIGNRSGEGWGVTFDDPMKGPMENRAEAVGALRSIVEVAECKHGEITEALTHLRADLGTG